MRLEPFLNVSNGPEAIAFYKSAFGANVLFLIPPETGSTIAQLEISGASFWLADESPDHQNPGPTTLGGSTVRLVLTVDDPDTLFNQAVAAGATVILAHRRPGLRLAHRPRPRPLRTPLGNRQASPSRSQLTADRCLSGP